MLSSLFWSVRMKALSNGSCLTDVTLRPSRWDLIYCVKRCIFADFFLILSVRTTLDDGVAISKYRSHAFSVFEYIEGYYNRQRPHSTIGYQIPAERMDAFMGRIEAALAGDGETGGEMPLAA